MSESGGPLPLRVASVADDADRAVLVRIADGELGALDDLYERYKTMAYSIAYRITNDPTLAEDVVQDAFLGAWRNAARYVEGRGSVKTWLLSIVHHRAIDAVRRRRPTSTAAGSNGGHPSEAVSLVPCCSPSTPLRRSCPSPSTTARTWWSS